MRHLQIHIEDLILLTSVVAFHKHSASSLPATNMSSLASAIPPGLAIHSHPKSPEILPRPRKRQIRLRRHLCYKVVKITKPIRALSSIQWYSTATPDRCLVLLVQRLNPLGHRSSPSIAVCGKKDYREQENSRCHGSLAAIEEHKV